MASKRGASLHFGLFSQLSIRRTCTQQRSSTTTWQQKVDYSGAEQYEALVRRESERRRLDEQPASFYQPHAFSTSQLDTAYHTVEDATSRARSTNDAEFLRLRQAAMTRWKQSSTKRRQTTECPTAHMSNGNTLSAIALTDISRLCTKHSKLTPSHSGPPPLLRYIVSFAHAAVRQRDQQQQQSAESSLCHALLSISRCMDRVLLCHLLHHLVLFHLLAAFQRALAPAGAFSDPSTAAHNRVATASIANTHSLLTLSTQMAALMQTLQVSHIGLSLHQQREYTSLRCATCQYQQSVTTQAVVLSCSAAMCHATCVCCGG